MTLIRNAGFLEWHLLCWSLMQRPIRLKTAPKYDLPKMDVKGPPSQKMWKSLTKEQREQLRKAMDNVHEDFMHLLRSMPKGMYLILRYYAFKFEGS